jgi:hypothetical protein
MLCEEILGVEALKDLGDVCELGELLAVGEDEALLHLGAHAARCAE